MKILPLGFREGLGCLVLMALSSCQSKPVTDDGRQIVGTAPALAPATVPAAVATPSPSAVEPNFPQLPQQQEVVREHQWPAEIPRTPPPISISKPPAEGDQPAGAPPVSEKD